MFRRKPPHSSRQLSSIGRSGLRLVLLTVTVILLSHLNIEGVVRGEWELGASTVKQVHNRPVRRVRTVVRRKKGKLGRGGETSVEVMVGTSEQEPD